MGYRLNLKDSFHCDSTCYSVYYYKEKLYVGNDALSRLDVSSDGELSNKVNGGGSFPVGIATDGTYLYSVGNNRLYAANLSTMGWITNVSLGFTPTSIAIDASGHIYVGGASYYHVRAYTFDGSAFTLRGTSPNNDASVRRLLWDGTHIIALFDDPTDFIRAFTFDGVNFSTVHTQSVNGETHAIAYDGAYVYAGSGETRDPNLFSYTFDGLFSAVNSGYMISSGTCYGLDSDGQYLYSAESGSRLAVYDHNPATGFSVISNISDASIPVGYYHPVHFGGGIVFWVSGEYVKSAKLDLTSEFSADKTKIKAGDSVTFTGIA